MAKKQTKKLTKIEITAGQKGFEIEFSGQNIDYTSEYYSNKEEMVKRINELFTELK
jgi:hypothetical protein